MINKVLSPFDCKDSNIFYFDIDDYISMLNSLDINKIQFQQYWQEKYKSKLIEISSIKNLRVDWLWAFYLPFLSFLTRKINDHETPLILGLSAPPGSGKSTAGTILESISEIMNISLSVISLDDFYLPSEQMNIAIKGNPWDVPRGFPGSHSVDELISTIDLYLKTGEVSVPQFDKSLRNGLGDRSGYRKIRSKVLLIEGWFLGCKPSTYSSYSNKLGSNLSLNNDEVSYRDTIQKSLVNYLPIWKNINKLWQFKTNNFNNIETWKLQQEKNMMEVCGRALKGEQFQSFIRMINTSIPSDDLNNLDSDLSLTLDKDRKIIKIDNPYQKNKYNDLI